MRSGGCAVQQALTSEAAGVVKQSVVLAKRRGHAQVTPLHVANTMLAAGGGLLRAACLQSHSHPLQCKALELCFNVALNRLPASSSNPILGQHHHSQYPSISNALVAAFKRAQAHQRRGAADNQQQQPPLLTAKIELEQLVVSILDDPSVSRVMREAGFSSTQVKINVEKATSLELCPQRSKSKENKVVILDNERKHSPNVPTTNDDSNFIIEALLTSKRNRSFAVVGESISDLETAVKEVMDRVERGGGVHEALREVKFITLPPFYTFCNVGRELVQQKMEELEFLVKSLVGKGVVLYVGDLNWISEYRVSLERERERSYYCSVEHVIMELGRLVSGINGEIGRFWLMGIATFQTYMRCRNGYNSLEMIWRLHPVTIPANSLGLSLVSQSDIEHGSSKCEGEAPKLQNGATLSSPPSWLKLDESRPLSNYNDQNCDSIKELSKNCNSTHRQPKSIERTLTLLSSTSPSSSTSCFSFDQHNPNLQQTHFSLNSPSSADTVDAAPAPKFKEFNARNLNILCNWLEEKVPWQKEIIPEIAGTILQCRSGMLRRRDVVEDNLDKKEETWLFFLGPDSRGKEEVARNLANIVFGSCSNFVSIERDDRVGSSYGERFARAVSANPHRVFLLGDLERVDCSSRMRIKRAIESGRILSDENGEEFCLFDAIIVLSCSSSPSQQRTENVGGGAGEEGRVSLDLNMSFRDDSVENMQSFHDLGILENVDRLVVFKIQD